MWSLAVKDYHSEWLQMKEKYPIGCIVQGAGKYFYPWGTIVKGHDFEAVYQGREDLLHGKSLIARVIGYGESNMWLVLSKNKKGNDMDKLAYLNKFHREVSVVTGSSGQVRAAIPAGMLMRNRCTMLSSGKK